MIKIVYDRKKHLVTVNGHAQSAPHGEDLVCAAVSALAYTLAENVERMAKDKNKFRRAKTELAEGKAVVSLDAVHGFESVLTLVFDAICVGFEVIADKKPECVEYKVVG